MPIQQHKAAEHSRAWLELHGGYERKAYKRFKAALKEQIAPVVSYLKNYGVPSAAVVDMLVTKKPMQSAYKDVYVSVGVKHAGYTRNQINATARAMKSSSLFSDGWRKLMEVFFNDYSSKRISDVTDTTRERVKKLLADNTDLSISQQASLLESDDFTRARALTIARTESTAAANYGASLGAESADFETNKQWLAVLDSNTRPDHVAADGQLVGNDEMFIVGGFQCLYPGDLSLPPQECIQCRCTTLYIPILSASGLPILKSAT